MHRVRLVAVLAEDKVGTLARTTGALAQAGINIRWCSIASGDHLGVINLLVDRTEDARQCLAQHGFTVSLKEVLAVEVEDRPGGLHEIADLLAHQGIGIANASGVVLSSGKRAVLIFEVDDVVAAQAALKGKHVHFVKEEELRRL